jgi:LmbE family N-acetylglucosaminyl deacetylase
MEGLLALASFWEQVINRPTVHVRENPTSTSIPYVKKAVRPHYFVAPEKRVQTNREFFRQASFKKSTRKTSTSQSLKPRTTVIFAPHPDDEILCCSNLMADKKQKNENVKVVFLTNGDALNGVSFEEAREYGRLRKRESTEALASLGLGKSDLFFLNFPDGQLQVLDMEGETRSPFTDQNKSLGGHVFPYSPYTRVRLKQNIREILKRWNVTEVYLPSKKDNHSDHRTTAKLIREVLTENTTSPKTFTYLVHGSVFQATDETKIDHDKLRLIRLFKSQFWTEKHATFLEQFAGVSEQFREN